MLKSPSFRTNELSPDPLYGLRALVKYISFFIGICLLLVSEVPCQTIAEDTAQSSGENQTEPPETISIARATWDTGWFQTEIFVNLLETLGYTVAPPVTMENPVFYKAAARGDADLWVNGWFPTHNAFMKEEGVKGKVEAVGFQVMAGALQGYMADKATAHNLGITNLGDLKNPDLAAVFDRNGNGKADLIGCNAGWGCEQVIEHHLDVYDLRDTVEHVQGDYSPLMDETAARYDQGKPVLFYTWTPNWTVGRLIPGKDVVWLETPFPSLPENQRELTEQTIINDVTGCVANPCAMGFPPNDIRVVANTAFLDRRPDIRQLLKSVQIPLEDISRQNARMLNGEDTYDDIRRHADEWVRNHQRIVDRWLEGAEALQDIARKKALSKTEDSGPKPDTLRVVTLLSEPFVIYRDGKYAGFSIELWENIAQAIGTEYEIYGVNTIAKLLDEVRRGVADVAVAGIGITSQRERTLDFSHAYFEAGLQIMVLESPGSVIREVASKVRGVMFSSELVYAGGVFFFALMIAAHIIWILERHHNPEFSKDYPQGIWQSTWWAVVTVTTVGYGDKTPRRAAGRLFGIVWILAGYFVFAYFTAGITTTATIQELHGDIQGPEDLFGKKTATVEKSTAAEYLTGQGFKAELVGNAYEAYDLLKSGKVDAVVYDAPVLQHYAATEGKGEVRVVGLVFQEKSYGMALQVRSPYRDKINIALLKLIEDEVYQQIKEKWFGS